eukprot:g13594.t1
MDNRFEPLRDSRDFSIPISSFESLWPEGEERKVASRPCGPEKLEKTLGDASIVSVSFGGGVTPQGHLAVLTTPQFCVGRPHQEQGLPGGSEGVVGIPDAAV